MSATQSEPQAKPAEKVKQHPTEYVVLQQQFSQSEISRGEGTDKHWTEIGRGKGVNAQKAIEAVVGDKDDVTGTFIAVPARSWKPLTPKPETTTRLRWS